MSAPPFGASQRGSFRCPVTGQRKAELVVGESRFSVLKEDESATGYGVQAEQSLGLQRGDVAELRIADARFEVRVTRVAVVRPAATDSDSHRVHRKTFHLGLERIRDLTEITYKGWRSVRWRDILFPPWISSPRTPILLVGITLLLLVVLVPVGVILALRAPDSPIFRTSPLESLFGWGQGHDAGDSGPGRSPSGDPDAAPLLVPESLYPTMDRLLGGAAQTASQALRKLDLTPGQQRQLRRLLEQTAEAMQRLDARRARLSAGEQSQLERRLLDTFRRKVSDLLTAQQGETWKVLSPQAPANKE